MMKRWPKDETEYVPFEKLMAPLVKAMHHQKTDFDYSGYEPNFREAATTPQPDDALSAKTL